MVTRNDGIIESKVDTLLNHRKLRFNPEGYVIIWVDSDIASTSESVQLQNDLSQITDSSYIFDNIDACKVFIADTNIEMTIFIVISKLFANDLLLHVFNISQVESIFILCQEGTTYTLEDKYSQKLLKVFDNKRTLLNQLDRAIKQHSFQWNVPLVEQSFAETLQVQRLTDEKRSNQVLFSLLTHLPYDDNEMIEMITKCRSLFRHNKKILETMNKFEQEYSSEMAINWYSKNNFLHRVVNQAFRTRNIDIIKCFRPFLVDLNTQLNDLYIRKIGSMLNQEKFLQYLATTATTQKRDLKSLPIDLVKYFDSRKSEFPSDPLIVYRGQYLRTSEINTLCSYNSRCRSHHVFCFTEDVDLTQCIDLLREWGHFQPALEGRRLVLNTFASASTNEVVAKLYISEGNYSFDDHEPVILRIVIDELQYYKYACVNLSYMPSFVDIREYSDFEQENEILFSPGCSFSVGKIEKPDTNADRAWWSITLHLQSLKSHEYGLSIHTLHNSKKEKYSEMIKKELLELCQHAIIHTEDQTIFSYVHSQKHINPIDLVKACNVSMAYDQFERGNNSAVLTTCQRWLKIEQELSCEITVEHPSWLTYILMLLAYNHMNDHQNIIQLYENELEPLLSNFVSPSLTALLMIHRSTKCIWETTLIFQAHECIADAYRYLGHKSKTIQFYESRFECLERDEHIEAIDDSKSFIQRIIKDNIYAELIDSNQNPLLLAKKLADLFQEEKDYERAFNIYRRLIDLILKHDYHLDIVITAFDFIETVSASHLPNGHKLRRLTESRIITYVCKSIDKLLIDQKKDQTDTNQIISMRSPTLCIDFSPFTDVNFDMFAPTILPGGELWRKALLTAAELRMLGGRCMIGLRAIWALAVTFDEYRHNVLYHKTSYDSAQRFEEIFYFNQLMSFVLVPMKLLRSERSWSQTQKSVCEIRMALAVKKLINFVIDYKGYNELLAKDDVINYASDS